jgi:hypothetical protein
MLAYLCPNVLLRLGLLNRVTLDLRDWVVRRRVTERVVWSQHADGHGWIKQDLHRSPLVVALVEREGDAILRRQERSSRAPDAAPRMSEMVFVYPL